VTRRTPAPAAGWFVYIVESARGALYTGVTTSVERRLREHAASSRGARFFRLGSPAGLRYVEPAPDRSAAQRREAAIKRLPRRAKLALIERAKPPA
jgi:putative endonuclease